VIALAVARSSASNLITRAWESFRHHPRWSWRKCLASYNSDRVRPRPDPKAVPNRASCPQQQSVDTLTASRYPKLLRVMN
jgi:hypothetical protein